MTKLIKHNTKNKRSKFFSVPTDTDVSPNSQKSGILRKFLEWIARGAEKTSLREKSCPS